jgi:hypothetical protein
MKKTIAILITAFIVCLLMPSSIHAQKLLIPMDFSQTDHLKAYGIAYWCLTFGQKVEWLLNYRGGSFLVNDLPQIEEACRLRGVSFETIDGAGEAQVKNTIEQNNMEAVVLEKAPKIAIYAPPFEKIEQWDDAVSLALTYADIPFDLIYDREILEGRLADYDWLHLHHEDFTGQYGKFYGAYRNTAWYKQIKALSEQLSRELGFKKVSKLKLAVGETIRQYVAQGGFLFAMCSATDTYDISLAANATDIVPAEFDGDPPNPDCQQKLDFDACIAFDNFKAELSPVVYEHSNIDTSPKRGGHNLTPEADYFTLFDFSAKFDPVPTMLVQNHVPVVNGFWGQTTGYTKETIKKHIIILADTEGKNEAKYIHGNLGKGTFTFLGGHDPEDYQHMVGDPPTDLRLHKNSPGYRLILNNVLFPAAKKQERKT